VICECVLTRMARREGNESQRESEAEKVEESNQELVSKRKQSAYI
jgi:hypothetical protein